MRHAAKGTLKMLRIYVGALRRARGKRFWLASILYRGGCVGGYIKLTNPPSQIAIKKTYAFHRN
jgi:hypothetical protein